MPGNQLPVEMAAGHCETAAPDAPAVDHKNDHQNHDHQTMQSHDECIAAGCGDCIGSVVFIADALTVSGVAPLAGVVHSDPVTPLLSLRAELLYRPPITG